MRDLNRIEIEEVGANPVRLATAIVTQLGDITGPMPVHDIARALDIEEIREESLTSIEGCLLTDRQKSYGSILVNAASRPRRRPLRHSRRSPNAIPTYLKTSGSSFASASLGRPHLGVKPP